MHPRYWLFALSAVALGAAALWFIFTGAPRVQVAAPLRGPAVEAVYATGNVEPVHWAKVGPKSTARIVEILAREGERVKRNQLLARLNDDEARARADQLAAQERLLRDEVKRLTPLFNKGYVGKQAYDRAVSEHRQAQANLDAARYVVEELSLRAPMDGVVLRQDGEPGETATGAQVLFWVGEASPLRITAEVDEEDIPRVRPGQRVVIKADAFPAETLEGVIAEITPKGDPLNKSYRVRVTLPPDTKLQIGMTTEVNIITRATPDALLVPLSAVANGALWLVRDGKAERRGVKTGAVDDKQIEITEGLTGAENIIVTPPAGLKEGQAVRVKAR
ncbi:MAG: efflux RND transporter periplasmic adaptor subunit [Gammaproteobacteria bacterium]|nr:MAG: efflux RND transporter periplasmic adaptor subunit [Gammaproteobacteria bacterium]